MFLIRKALTSMGSFGFVSSLVSRRLPHATVPGIGSSDGAARLMCFILRNIPVSFLILPNVRNPEPHPLRASHPRPLAGAEKPFSTLSFRALRLSFRAKRRISLGPLTANFARNLALKMKGASVFQLLFPLSIFEFRSPSFQFPALPSQSTSVLAWERPYRAPWSPGSRRHRTTHFATRILAKLLMGWKAKSAEV